jgi:hypothetical protein
MNIQDKDLFINNSKKCPLKILKLKGSITFKIDEYVYMLDENSKPIIDSKNLNTLNINTIALNAIKENRGISPLNENDRYSLNIDSIDLQELY